MTKKVTIKKASKKNRIKRPPAEEKKRLLYEFFRLTKKRVTVKDAALKIGVPYTTLRDWEEQLGAIAGTPTNAIHLAAQHGSLEKVRSLLKGRPTLAWARDKNNVTTLHKAVSSGRNEIVELLVEKWKESGRELDGEDAEDLHGRTPIHYAEGEESKKVVMTLVDAGADLKHQDKDGRTPIFIRGHEATQAMLERGANPKHRAKDGATPFLAAVEKYHEEEYRNEDKEYSFFKKVLEVLRDNGADPNQGDNNGSTPLHFAVARKDETLVKLLVKKYGADVNAVDDEGITPLFLAIDEKDEEVTRLLIINGADPYQPCYDPWGNKKRKFQTMVEFAKSKRYWSIEKAIKDELDKAELEDRNGKIS